MKKLIKTRIVFLTIIAIWSANAFAGEKAKHKPISKEEAMPVIEDWQFTPLAVEKFEAERFEKIWMYVGKSFGYPKSGGTSREEQNGSMTITISWGDDSWMPANFSAWNSFNNVKRFYIAGIFTRLSAVKDEQRTNEEYKSEFIANYQCVNAMTDFMSKVAEKGLNVKITVNDVFQMCGMGRIGNGQS